MKSKVYCASHTSVSTVMEYQQELKKKRLVSSETQCKNLGWVNLTILFFFYLFETGFKGRRIM